MNLLSPITEPTCSVCNRPNLLEGKVCSDCQLISHENRVQNVSVFSYTPKTKKILARYKYHGDERYATFLGSLMGEVVDIKYRDKGLNLITSVPLHDSRMKERGFNQSQLLAEQIGNFLDLPTQTILERKKPSLSQASLNRAARLAALQDAFELTMEAKQLDLATYTILLVDDVYTTGTTIRECAKILRTAGVHSIYAITFAR